MVAKDGYMYETDWESGSLMITNVTNPYEPVVTFAEGDFLDSPYYIVRVGNTVFVESSDESGGGRVTSFDISNPANVQQLDVIDIAGAGLGCNNISGIYAAADALLLDVSCFPNKRLLAIDVANPAAMSFGDNMDYSPYSSTSSVTTIQQSGNSSYVYFGSTSLYIEIDMSDPSNMNVTENVPAVVLPNFDEPVRQKVGDYVYAVTYSYVGGLREYDLHAIDVSNPASPALVTTIDLCSVKYSSTELKFVGGNRIIGACNAELFDIDVSNPLAPVIGPKATTLETFVSMYVDTDGRVYQNADFENVITEQVYDASTPGVAPSFLGANVNDLGGHGYSTYMMVPPGSQIAYVMQHTWPIVRTVDISDPNNMRVLDTQFLTQGGQLLDRFLFSNRANVSFTDNGDFMLIADTASFDPATWEGELDVIDIRDPSNITVADRVTMPLSDNYLTSKVVDDTWYVMNDDSLKTFQINPATGILTLLDTQAYTPPGGFSVGNSRLAIVNDTALMMFGQQSARAIDITDPANLGVATTTSLPVMSSYSVGQPYTLNDHILVSTGGSPGWVRAIDASNPAALTLSSSVSNSKIKSGTFQAFGANELLLSNAQGDDFSKIDVSNLNSIQLSEITGNGGLFPDALDGFDEVWDGLAISGNYAFGASSIADGNLYSFDISDLTTAKPLDVISRQTPLYQPQSLHAANGKLYVGSRTYTEVNANLVSYDLTNPDAPVYDGTSVHEFTDILDIATKGNRLYAARYEGLGVYDTTNPRFPVLKTLASDAGSAKAIAIDGNRLYLADAADGLLIYDITTPDSPVLLSTFTDVNFTGLDSIEVVGSTLYGVMDGANKVVIIDVSNGAAPTTITTVSDSLFNELSKVFVSGDRLYVSSRGDTLTLNDSVTAYDISTPTSPVKVSQYVADDSTLGYAAMEFYQGFILVTATDGHRIDVIDFNDEAEPTLEQSIGTDGSLQGVNEMKVVGNRLYVASQFGNSLNTYSLVAGGASEPPVTPPASPETPTASPSTPAAPNAGIASNPGWLQLIAIGLFLAILVIRKPRFIIRSRLR